MIWISYLCLTKQGNRRYAMYFAQDNYLFDFIFYYFYQVKKNIQNMLIVSNRIEASAIQWQALASE
jgi:hypothetical protein